MTKSCSRASGVLSPLRTRVFVAFIRIVYRDLKPENVPLTAEGKVKLADFEFAKVVVSGAAACVVDFLSTGSGLS